MKRLFIFAFMSLFTLSAFSQNSLIISVDDLRLEYDEETSFENSSGYHLYIRKKDGIQSVLLTETTKDPAGVSDNYAFRAKEYNPVNGDEIRYLNGKPLVSEYSKYSLIDSTAEEDKEFGQAFHIFIPSQIVYGYPWSRNGTVKIDKGTFINIRTYSKPYADYEGEFIDNPFMFDLGVPSAIKEREKVMDEETFVDNVEEELIPAVLPKKEKVILTDDYNPVAAQSFRDIAGFGGGMMVFSKGPETIVDDIMDSIDRIPDKKNADIVFAIDSTGSMKDDIQKLREEWIPRLIEKAKEFSNLRLALLLYRDYGDTYKYMNLPVKRFDFTDNIDLFTKNLNGFVILGKEGGDIPEAVYEALYASMDFYVWRKDAYRKIILIGDAEPHPKPRGSGKYDKDLVASLAQEKGIVIDTIIVPDDKEERRR